MPSAYSTRTWAFLFQENIIRILTKRIPKHFPGVILNIGKVDSVVERLKNDVTGL